MQNSRKPVKKNELDITSLIYAVRGKQVMLDSDLAVLYRVETKVLNQAVKRNINRFPEEFRFKLSDEEFKSLRSQIVTSNLQEKHGGRRYNPYVFTEEGIAMLSAVLRSDVAVEISVKIMCAFVEMRRFLIKNTELFSRLDRLEVKQLQTDKKLEKVFNYIASKAEIRQNIFFDGQIYDAFSFITKLIKKAKKSIVLIDNYVDIQTLDLLRKKNKNAALMIISGKKGNLTNTDIEKFNMQYPGLMFKIKTDFHDRFLILDKKTVYHIGASIKDAGKKTFGITEIEDKDLIANLIKKIDIQELL